MRRQYSLHTALIGGRYADRMRSVRGSVAIAVVSGLIVTPAARADRLGYSWQTPSALAGGDELSARIAPPAGAARVPVAAGSFGDWLRHLPLRPRNSPVLLFDGTRKPRQDVHQAVVDIDVGRRDLQQCADAVMRLRAEYLFAAGRFDEIVFHPQPGSARTIAWTGGARRDGWDRFLMRLFAAAGSASLDAELPRASDAPLPGDVLIQGGYPGHAVLILDVAEDPGGRRYLLLGQSYMPAQQIHVLKNLGDSRLSPWYDAAALNGQGIATPEWRPFKLRDWRRFAR
jgi:hypothetical protein